MIVNGDNAQGPQDALPRGKGGDESLWERYKIPLIAAGIGLLIFIGLFWFGILDDPAPKPKSKRSRGILPQKKVRRH